MSIKSLRNKITKMKVEPESNFGLSVISLNTGKFPPWSPVKLVCQRLPALQEKVKHFGENGFLKAHMPY